MFFEPLVGLVDQPLIELRFAHSRFVSGDKQDCIASRVEGESYASDASIGSETEFLHVRVARTVQRVYLGPSQGWPNLPQCRKGRDKLNSDRS